MLNIPNETEKQTAIKNFMDDLNSYHIEITRKDNGKKELKPVICAVCDGIAKCPNWTSWVEIDKEFKELCLKTDLRKKRVENIYKSELLESYTAPDERLHDFILSPQSIIHNDNILVCKDCLSYMRKECKKWKNRKRYTRPPKEAIANGYIIGEAPKELTDLTEIELTLISKVKIHCHIWVFFAGCHKQIRGWHTFYKNRTKENISSLQTLEKIGIKGNIMVVLCGPFTSSQKAAVMEATHLRPKKVINAMHWLVSNNYHYNIGDIPKEDEFPKIIVMEDKNL